MSKKMTLKEFKEWKGLTNLELANLLDEAPAKVHQWINGVKDPDSKGGERRYPTPRHETMIKIFKKTGKVVDFSCWYR